MFIWPSVFLARWAAGLLAVVVVLGGAWWYGRAGGFEARDLMCKAELAAVESRAIEAERQAHALREKGRALSDRLAAQVEEHRAELAAQSRRLNERIQSLARADRVALDAALTRMLNDRSVVRERTHGGVAGPAGAVAAGSDAAAAGDRDRSSGGASERSVATWIVTAQEYYETCRGRLHALQTWAKEVAR